MHHIPQEQQQLQLCTTEQISLRCTEAPVRWLLATHAQQYTDHCIEQEIYVHFLHMNPAAASHLHLLVLPTDMHQNIVSVL